MKRALVLSGGASRGSFETGALRYLTQDLGRSYDSLHGISVGALNVGFLSLYPKEQEKEAFINLENLWKALDDTSMKKNWAPFGVVHGLWLDSIYSSKPLRDLVYKTMDLNKVKNNGRLVTVGAVSLQDASYKVFNGQDDCFLDAMLASSAFPMGLEPVVINGQKYTDGGVQHIIPMQEAIDSGAEEIDVVICSPIKTTAAFGDVDAVTLGLRCFELMTDQIVNADLKLADLYNQLVSVGLAPGKKLLKINVIRPETDLSIGTFSFTNEDVRATMEIGYQTAKKQFVL